MRHAALFLAAAIACPGVAAQTRADFGVRIPMRDGVQLTADVWRPEDGARHPVLLVRTPYLRTGLGLVDWGRYFAERGYAFVAQDTRGRGDSDGEFSFFAGDGEDGFDTIEWLARQPWSDGKVGMLGVSYLGTVQWLAAKHRPPHLTCMAPTAPGGRWFDELPYLGGAFAHAWALNWVNGTSGRTLQTPNAAGVDWERVLAHRPLLTADSVMGRVMPLYRSWLEHPVEGPFWRRIELRAEDFAGIAIPTLTTTGWYDADQPGSLMYWRELMANAPKPSEHFLVIGPWGHAETFVGGKTRVGELEFPPSVVIDNKQAHLDFFDWCLKGGGSYDAPRARIFVTGANEWRSYDSYPPKDVVETPLYLASGGNANGRSGDGRLVWRAEPRSLPDTFTYDPKRPVPAAIEVAAVDRQRLQDRPDVLVYTGEPLREPLELIGSVFVDLTVASDALDTDFVAVLSDVHPDGKAVQLGSRIAIKRARYRNGYAREELLEPGRPTPIRIELFDVAHRFLAGHRLRLEVTSSAAPYYNPNQNTGNPVATDVDWKVAHQTVFHDASRPSVITLPLLPRRAPR